MKTGTDAGLGRLVRIIAVIIIILYWLITEFTQDRHNAGKPVGMGWMETKSENPSLKRGLALKKRGRKGHERRGHRSRAFYPAKKKILTHFSNH